MKKIILILLVTLCSITFAQQNRAHAALEVPSFGGLFGKSPGKLEKNTPGEAILADPGCHPDIRNVNNKLSNSRLDDLDNLSKGTVNMAAAPAINDATCMKELSYEIASMGAIFTGEGILTETMNDFVVENIATMINGVMSKVVAPFLNDFVGSFPFGETLMSFFGFGDQKGNFSACKVMKAFWEAFQCADFDMPRIDVGIGDTKVDFGCIGNALIGEEFEDNLNELRDDIIVDAFKILTVQKTLDESLNVIRKKWAPNYEVSDDSCLSGYTTAVGCVSQ